MADPKTVTKTIYNTGDGPRSIVARDGTSQVIPAGGSAEVSIFEGELDDLAPDLTTTKPKAPAPSEPAPAPAGSTNTDLTSDAQARAVEELATQLQNANTRDELLDIAKREDVAIETDDNKAQLALKIAQKRLGVEPK